MRCIHTALLPLLDAGREAVLVCHSHGGVAGSAAVEDQTLADRAARGLLGGVKAVVYISSFAFPEKGMSIMRFIGGEEKVKGIYYPEVSGVYIYILTYPPLFSGSRD